MKIFKPVLAATIYTFLMGAGWVINPHPYGEIDNVIFMIPILLILSLWVIFLLKKSDIKLLPKKTNKPLILWLFVGVIGYLMLVNFLIYLDGKTVGPISKILLLLMSTLLVGFAEEGMYRGYILNFIENKLGVKRALFYSSILFGLLHSVNFLAGPTIGQTAAQVILTSAIGYVFGIIYLKTNRNLLLIMTLHGIYDFLVFSSVYLGGINNSMYSTILAVPLLLVLWAYSLIRKYTN